MIDSMIYYKEIIIVGCLVYIFILTRENLKLKKGLK